jgi:hypothetical protein
MQNSGRATSCRTRKYHWGVHVLLLMSLCLWLQVIPGYAEDLSLTDEEKQAKAEKAAEVKPRGKWLPIPIFITEPAVGFGLGASLAYFHPTKAGAEPADESSSDDQKTPPNITGIAGGYTESDTWAVAIGHSHTWRNDTIRYAGGVAYADVKSQIYLLDKPFDFNLKAAGLFQQIKFRLGKSDFFLGGKLLWLGTKSAFDVPILEDTGIEFDDIESSNVGVALTASYDKRDNVFTPNTGQFVELGVWRHDEAIGSDYDYWSASFKALSFHRLHPRFVLGLRLETSGVDGRPPFYAIPWVGLRGIPTLRYQGQKVGMIKAEGRWNILERWALLGFVGAGAVEGNDPSLRTDQDIYAGGAGVRYFLMRDMGLWLGIDVARGPEDWYTYITVGQAWSK